MARAFSSGPSQGMDRQICSGTSKDKIKELVDFGGNGPGRLVSQVRKSMIDQGSSA